MLTLTRAWVDWANLTYASANVSFQFDPQKDFSVVRNSVVNGIAFNPADRPDWDLVRTAANQIAAAYPGKMTLIFRWGPNGNPNGDGFMTHSSN